MVNPISYFAVHPGEYLREVLDAVGMTQSELASRLDLSEKHLSQIANGKQPVSTQVAVGLATVFPQTPAHVWTTMQSHFDELQELLRIRAELEGHRDWVALFPYAELAQRGAVPSARGAADRGQAILEFFGVSGIEGWIRTYCGDLCGSCRADQVHDTEELTKQTAAFLSWVRLGELRFNQVVSERGIPKFDKAKLDVLIPQIRARVMDVESPQHTFRAVADLLEGCGVALLFERELKSMGTYGFTPHPVRGKPALVQISLHRKQHAQYVFTLFHELAHLIVGPDEQQANMWARNILVPEREYETFLAGDDYSAASISQFADQIAVHPGVVLGRLQHDGVIPWSSHGQLHVNGFDLAA